MNQFEVGVFSGQLHPGLVNHMLFFVREQGYRAAIQMGVTLAWIKKSGSGITAAFQLNSFYGLSQSHGRGSDFQKLIGDHRLT